VAAEQQTKARCLPGLAKVTAAVASAAYDGPGGSKIGYRGLLGPATSWQNRGAAKLATFGDARGRAHIGWISSLDGTTSCK
jgi:hypothetical protein